MGESISPQKITDLTPSAETKEGGTPETVPPSFRIELARLDHAIEEQNARLSPPEMSTLERLKSATKRLPWTRILATGVMLGLVGILASSPVEIGPSSRTSPPQTFDHNTSLYTLGGELDRSVSPTPEQTAGDINQTVTVIDEKSRESIPTPHPDHYVIVVGLELPGQGTAGSFVRGVIDSIETVTGLTIQDLLAQGRVSLISAWPFDLDGDGTPDNTFDISGMGTEELNTVVTTHISEIANRVDQEGPTAVHIMHISHGDDDGEFNWEATHMTDQELPHGARLFEATYSRSLAGLPDDSIATIVMETCHAGALQTGDKMTSAGKNIVVLATAGPSFLANVTPMLTTDYFLPRLEQSGNMGQSFAQAANRFEADTGFAQEPLAGVSGQPDVFASRDGQVTIPEDTAANVGLSGYIITHDIQKTITPQIEQVRFDQVVRNATAGIVTYTLSMDQSPGVVVEAPEQVVVQPLSSAGFAMTSTVPAEIGLTDLITVQAQLLASNGFDLSITERVLPGEVGSETHPCLEFPVDTQIGTYTYDPSTHWYTVQIPIVSSCQATHPIAMNWINQESGSGMRHNAPVQVGPNETTMVSLSIYESYWPPKLSLSFYYEHGPELKYYPLVTDEAISDGSPRFTVFLPIVVKAP